MSRGRREVVGSFIAFFLFIVAVAYAIATWPTEKLVSWGITLLTFALVYSAVTLLYVKTTRRRRVSGDSGVPQDRMLLVGNMESLDFLVGTGQLLYKMVQPLEGRILGMYAVATIIPEQGEAYDVAIEPGLYSELVYKGRGGAEE